LDSKNRKSELPFTNLTTRRARNLKKVEFDVFEFLWVALGQSEYG
jgi:hypothetical protein